MKIGVIGTGYVGLIQSVGLSEFGYNVIGIDIDETKVNLLNKGISPLYEEGLEELLKKNIKNNLKFTTDYNNIKDCDIIFLCVGTPQDKDGNADLKYIYSATESIKKNIDKDDYKIVVLKSTVPIGTNRKIKEHLKDYNIDVVSNPEFLREGIAVYDFFNPERIVLGFENLEKQKPINILKDIYGNFNKKSPIIITNWESAEMIKYASNAFLATKISFANELAKLSDKVGSDIKTVCKAMGIDSRIGPKFLNAGIGYGGSCFHPDEMLFVDFGKGLMCLTFKELFNKLNKGNNNLIVKILSADENLKLNLVDLKLITKRDYSDDLIVLKTSMGREIKITKDHPIVVIKDNKLKIKLAEDVKEEDEIVLPNGCFNNNNNLVEINVLDEIKNTSLIENTYLNNKNMVLNEFENIKSHLSNKYIYDVKKNGTVRAKDLISFKNLLNKYRSSNRLFTVRSKSTTIPLIFKIDKDFARLIGYYLAEGWISEDYGRNNINRKRIMFSFGDNEYEYINDVKTILNKLNINYTEKINNGSHSIIISSKLLAYIFEEVLKCGNNCYNKQIPSQIFNSPNEVKWEFLKGILRGGGGLVRLNNNKNLNIEYRTVSKKLANSLIILLQSFGIVVSLKRCYHNKSTVLTYIIRINRLTQVRKIGELFGEKWNNYKEILDNYKRNIKPTGYKKYNNYTVLKIKSIKREYYNGEVYSVETDNNLLVSSYGLLIHNCFPKDVKALISQYKNNNLEPKLIYATDKVNEEQIKWFFNKIKENYNDLSGKTFAVLGLAFKPHTDDIRESRAIELIDLLLKEGTTVKGYDYVEKARENTINNYKYNRNKAYYGYNLYILDNIYKTVKDVDGIIITTEYNELNNEDWEKIKKLVNNPIIFDGRNILNKEKIKKIGFNYLGVGMK